MRVWARNLLARWEALPPWAAFLLIFVCGVAARLARSLLTGTYRDLDRFEMERVALSFARRGTLADPYQIPTGATAHVDPLYAMLLGLIFRWFGTGYGAEIVKELFSSAAAATLYGLLPSAAPAFGVSRLAGLAAGLFGALVPLEYLVEVAGDWEATVAALALFLVIWRLAVTWRRQEFTLLRGASEGLGWGVCALITSSLLSVFCLLMPLGLALARKSRRIPYLRYAAANICVLFLCLAPWAWRNSRQLGSAIFTRSNFGLELRMSNNDMAGPLEPENFKRGVYHAFHPLQSRSEAEAVRDMGEVAYNTDRLHKALSWIRTHRRRFLQLTVRRFLYTWFPSTPSHARDKFLWLLTIGSLIGILALWPSDRLGALIFSACLLSYTPIYYLIQVNIRYRYPVDWIILLTATHAAVVLAKHMLGRVVQQNTSVEAVSG
ncbi:MAG TPA: hypothetical protein VJ732_03180 [Bryobacteraceae bacterium]|nr:hypothetical protein [Bryobacteraceae bacterium]